MSQDFVPVYGEWKITETDLKGNVVSEREHTNLVVNLGKDMMISSLFGFPVGSSIVAMGVGASGVANDNVTAGVLVTDARLTYEIRGNGARKGITNTAGATITAADNVLNTQSISGVVYTKQVVLQGVFPAVDGTNGYTLYEYALFDTTALPGTSTASSGHMFNRFVDPAPITKSGTNAVTAQVTLRW